jgi:CubicO group peptidase (beta-lactamase class C family)
MTDPWLPSSDPEAQGLPSAAIESFIDAAEQQIDALHSFVLLRHGHAVAQGWWEPFRPELPHMAFSVTKSITSTAVGLAVAEGRLSVDDYVLSLLPEAAPETPSAHLAAMRVRHLLTMTTGHSVDPSEVPDLPADWAGAFLAAPVEHAPGSRFVYNSAASYLLSAILQRLTSATLMEYLRPRLFEPLGITDATWETCPRGINAGGWGLNLRTMELARFGQLYLDGGIWRGRRLVPADWIAEATTAQVRNDGRDAPIDQEQGYGYQFWCSRHGAYRADGAFGQLCVVMPEQDAVLVTTGGMPGIQPLLDLVWTHLLPAMAPEPLPTDVAARQRLQDRLASLRLPPVLGTAAPAAGLLGRTYAVTTPAASRAPRGCPMPDSITVNAAPRGWTVALRDANGEHDLPCGDGYWHTTPGAPGQSSVAATGGWLDPHTFQMSAGCPVTPFIRTITCRFSGTEMVADVRENVSFGPTEFPPLVARAT